MQALSLCLTFSLPDSTRVKQYGLGKAYSYFILDNWFARKDSEVMALRWESNFCQITGLQENTFEVMALSWEINFC